MAHKILHAYYIELDEKMMQTFDSTNTNYAANFQENIFHCSKKQAAQSLFKTPKNLTFTHCVKRN